MLWAAVLDPKTKPMCSTFSPRQDLTMIWEAVTREVRRMAMVQKCAQPVNKEQKEQEVQEEAQAFTAHHHDHVFAAYVGKNNNKWSGPA